MKTEKTLKIGVFDSGIGGLTVLSEAMHCFQNINFLYYADTAHVPYGERTPDEVLNYVQEAASFLIDEAGVDALVLACNTATSVAAASLRAQYDVPIIGMEPAVKPAFNRVHPPDREQIIVSATNMTLRLEKLKKLLNVLGAEDRVICLSLQKLVRFAEEGDFSSPEVRRYLEETFSVYDLDEVHALVLGCTHFNFFKPLLTEVLPEHISLIDGNVGTVSRLCSFFPTQCAPRSTPVSVEQVRFFDGGREMTGPELERMQNLLQKASTTKF